MLQKEIKVENLLVNWAKSIEEGLVCLSALMKHSGINLSSEKVVCGSNGVNITLREKGEKFEYFFGEGFAMSLAFLERDL